MTSVGYIFLVVIWLISLAILFEIRRQKALSKIKFSNEMLKYNSYDIVTKERNDFH